jgi:acyl-CoA thioesterase II
MPESASASRATEVSFTGLLNLEDHGDGRYRGVCHEGAPARAFGGHVAAQAFTAAAQTAPAGQVPASMDAYFAKAAAAGEPVDYVVTVTGDSNRLSHRSVTALQSPLRPEPAARDPYLHPTYEGQECGIS